MEMEFGIFIEFLLVAIIIGSMPFGLFALAELIVRNYMHNARNRKKADLIVGVLIIMLTSMLVIFFITFS